MDTIGTEKIVKVFIPVEKRKYNKKNLSRGLWLNESGRIESDLINCRVYNQSIEGLLYEDIFYRYLDNLKQIKTNGKNQECIFYKINNVGYIYYSRDKIQILPSRIYTEVKKESLKLTIKESLKKYSGLTIYQENKKFYIEVFTTI